MTVARDRRRIALEGLLQDHPDEVKLWVTNAPLKLVAAALADIRSMAKSGILKERLEGLVLEVGEKWNPWWDRVRPAVGDSRYFRTDRNKNGAIAAIGLAPGYYAEDVPAEPLPPKPARVPKKRAATLTDWKKWLLSEATGPPPGRFPTKPVSNALARWPSKTIGQVLRGAIQGAEECIESGSASARDAAGWLEAVSRATLRWRECTGPNSADGLTERTGKLAVQLAQVAGYDKGVGHWLLQAGALSGQLDAWRREFTIGMWGVFQDSRDGAGDLLMASYAYLGQQGQTYLAVEIALAAFRGNGPAPRHSQLDRLLDMLPARKRVQVVHNLILRSSDDDIPKEKVLDYLANSRHAAKLTVSSERLDTLTLAAIKLSEGQDQVTDLASCEIREALASSSCDKHGPAWRSLLSDGHKLISEIIERNADEVKSQRLTYDAKLEDMRCKEERLQSRVDDLRAEIAAGRETSRLDILEDVLTVIGEAIQSLRQRKDNPEGNLRDIEASLTLALRAGGAEEFGTVGEPAEYDPRFHQSDEQIPIESPVQVSAPGAVVHGKLTGDRVLIKARVVSPWRSNDGNSRC